MSLPYIYVTEISIDKSSVTMSVGNVYKLNAIVNPRDATNKKVLWTSNDNSIVTIDEDGLITAHKEGNTVVVALSQDGKKTAVSYINVKEKWITLSQNSISFGEAGGSSEFYLSASEDWSLISAPQWLTITPQNGVGQIEDSTTITISIPQIDPDLLHRSGSIIYKLTNWVYADTLQISQYNYTYGDGQYEIIQTSTVGNGIDLIFMGDGYTIEDTKQGKYKKTLIEAIEHFFNIEPYRTYRNYFDVYIVYAFSSESGISDHITTKNTRFSAKYDSSNSTRMSVNHKTVFEYAQKAPLSSNLKETSISIITNSSRYAGTNWSYSDGRSISIVPYTDLPYPNDFRGVVQHEIGGHGFGKLADEYVYYNFYIPLGEIPDLKKWQNWGFFLNVDVTNNLQTILWSHIISDSHFTYVGAYEGGYTYKSGVWRSEFNSVMDENISYFNAVSRELIVKQIKRLAGEQYSFEEFKGKDVRETEQLIRPDSTKYDAALKLPPPILIEVE